MRQEFTKATKIAAWERCGGHCDSCHQKIVGTPIYDHIVPTGGGVGGSAELSNCQVLCARCNRVKTDTKDIPEIAKSTRVLEKRLGLRRRGTAMPGTRRSGWRKRMDGTTERRPAPVDREPEGA